MSFPLAGAVGMVNRFHDGVGVKGTPGNVSVRRISRAESPGSARSASCKDALPWPSAPSQSAENGYSRQRSDAALPFRDRNLLPMPVRLYAMLTWTTLRRLPLINPEV